MASGSGRVLIPLLKQGFSIDGIDNSESMLDSCKKRCVGLGLNPDLFEADMCNFRLDKRYEAIVIPGGSIQLIELEK